MSIDLLQERIRKMKNPAVLDFSILPEHIPSHIRIGKAPEDAYAQFCLGLMPSVPM